MGFTYQCPACGTSNQLHDFECEYEGVDIHDFEKCYIDILSTLLGRQTVVENADGGDTLDMDWDWMTDNVPHGWTDKHTACFHVLKNRRYVAEHEDGRIEVLTADDRRDASNPSGGDIELVYEYGACNGCLDYGVSAMVSWCEMNDLTWDETVEFVTEWLHDTGTWERGDFEEPDEETLIAKKKHIWKNGIGWGRFANSTVRTMTTQGKIPDEEAH